MNRKRTGREQKTALAPNRVRESRRQVEKKKKKALRFKENDEKKARNHYNWGGGLTHLRHVRARARTYHLQVISLKRRRRVLGAVMAIIFHAYGPRPRGRVVIRIERDIGHDLAFLGREDRVHVLSIVSVSIRKEKRRIDN
jgi:hypothetical protein